MGRSAGNHALQYLVVVGVAARHRELDRELDGKFGEYAAQLVVLHQGIELRFTS